MGMHKTSPSVYTFIQKTVWFVSVGHVQTQTKTQTYDHSKFLVLHVYLQLHLYKPSPELRISLLNVTASGLIWGADSQGHPNIFQRRFVPLIILQCLESERIFWDSPCCAKRAADSGTIPHRDSSLGQHVQLNGQIRSKPWFKMVTCTKQLVKSYVVLCDLCVCDVPDVEQTPVQPKRIQGPLVLNLVNLKLPLQVAFQATHDQVIQLW